MLLLTAGAAVAGAGGLFLAIHRTATSPAPVEFTDLAGAPRTLKQWAGRVLLLNFWATWCAPCREEIPALVRVHKKLGGQKLEFVGIALDSAAKVQQFTQTTPISYPVLLGQGAAIQFMKELGNSSGGLPFTAVLRADGTIAYRHTGAVAEAGIEAELRTILG